MNNYYDLLGISPDASLKDIKVGFRKMSMKFHPDHNPDDPFSEQHFIKVKAAYDVLCDVSKKRSYDQSQKQYIDWLVAGKDKAKDKTVPYKLYMISFRTGVRNPYGIRLFFEQFKRLAIGCGFSPAVGDSYFIAVPLNITYAQLQSSIKQMAVRVHFVLVEMDIKTIFTSGIPEKTVQWLRDLNKVAKKTKV